MAQFPDLIDAIDLKEEVKNAKLLSIEMGSLQSRLKSRAAVPCQHEAAEMLGQQLKEANQALQQRYFVPARRLLEDILARNPDNPSALFGMG